MKTLAERFVEKLEEAQAAKKPTVRQKGFIKIFTTNQQPKC